MTICFTERAIGVFRGVLAALLLSLLPAGAALADTYHPPDNYLGANFLTINEISSNTIEVNMSLLGFSFSGDLTTPANEPGDWDLPPSVTAFLSSSLEGNSLVLGHVFWMQPGDNPNDYTNDLFMGFHIESCFCNGSVSQIEVASDLPYSTLANHDGANRWNDYYCIEPGSTAFVDCPIVPNGTPVSTPLVYEDADGNFQASPLVVTFTDDRGGGGVPEPEAWTLMLVGFGGLGALLRRRWPRLANA